jgi:pyruvate dehydrogenase E2 component (dihydrolipoamide acetyltransferase)
MPSLGADMEAGTLVKWLKKAGDTVKHGDIIAVVDTDKGAIEIEVFEDGVIDKLQVDVGQKVPVGTVLAVIGGASSPAVPSPPPVSAAREQPARTLASPAARKLAADRGVDLALLRGTGPQGAITHEDVERAAGATAQTTATAPARQGVDRATAMRTAVAAAMAKSKREIPHYYLSSTIDMGAALAWLNTENEKRAMPERLLPVVLLIKAVAVALHEVPELNGFWTNGALQQSSAMHVGCAISLRGGGLIAPGIHDADRKDLTTLMRDLRDLTARARTGSLRSSELADSTITITNLGERGVDSTFGIIYPPQVALVAFGRIAERPWVTSGKIEVRSLLTATLSADHRASDGHRGGLFLDAISRLLQTPETL